VQTTTSAVRNPPAPAALMDTISPAPPPFSLEPSLPAVAGATQARGTVVLDVGGKVAVPDFHGKALRAALEEAESAGIELEVSGSGVGQAQSPPAGARISPGGHVSVRFGR
jgi:hypothetical protein